MARARKLQTEAPEAHTHSKEASAGSEPTRSKRSEGRPMWTGSIRFGLVNIPIQMIQGVRRKSVRFHLLHAKDNARLQRRYFCSVEEKEVPPDEIKKAYDRGGGEHVIVEEGELAKLRPDAERAIDILYFVNHKEIDPAYYDMPYYLKPEKTALNSYQILVQALAHSGKAGVAQFVMRNRQYIGIVRADKTVLSLETLHFDDEVITPEELEWAPQRSAAKPAEVKMAETLIESLSTPFAPQKLRDTYRESVLKMIERKAAHKVVVAPTGEEREDPKVIDLMSALKASLAQAKHAKKRLKAA